MNAGRARELNPIDKLLERHLVFQLQRFGPFVERNDPVPRIANESEFKIFRELLSPDSDPAFVRAKQVEVFHQSMRRGVVRRPTRLQ